MSLLYLMRAIAHAHARTRTTFVYDTYCLGHWNEENQIKTKNIIVHCSLIFGSLCYLECCNSIYDFRIRGKF